MARLSGVLGFMLAAIVVEGEIRPYFGTWIINQAKSDVTRGVTGTFKDLGDGRVETSGMGQAQAFVVGRDGKDYPWMDGTTLSWKELGPGRYQHVQKRDGQVVNVAEYTVSSDGKTLSNVIRSTPSGSKDPVAVENTFVRVSGGPGIFGTWRPATVAGGGVQIEPANAGVLFRWKGFDEAVCQFDGKECAFKGPQGEGETMTLRGTGPRSFEYQHKRGGTLIYTSRFVVSDDGKTLTEDETQAAGEKRTIVYDRQ